MKHYPTEILLTVTEPKTGLETMRWFPVKNEVHEKFVRNQNATARATIAAARQRMAEAAGGEPQRLIVESLRHDFIEFHRREANHGGMDAARSEPGTESGNEGELHPDSEQERPNSPPGSGGGQTQGRESGQEGTDGVGLREGSEEPVSFAIVTL